jgi:hypothetical protein
MPPHCDSLDGPVVKAAREAIAERDAGLVLPYVKAPAEDELRAAFDLATQAWLQGDAARAIAERYLFETAVRLHREGEGATFTGLKPAGLDVGPVIPLAERAIETGSADALETALVEEVRHALHRRFREVQRAKPPPGADVAARRVHVESMLGLQVWAHGIYLAVNGSGHGSETGPHAH